jgi:5-hydroxyisourate hydrolase
MPGISIHVVDVVRGEPAVGMRVEVRAGAALVGEGVIGTDGQVAHAMTRGDGIARGVHEVLLHAADYYRAAGIVTSKEPAFLDVVSFRFTVVDPAEHYHLPFKISPWGLSVWRGR